MSLDFPFMSFAFHLAVLYKINTPHFAQYGHRIHLADAWLPKIPYTWSSPMPVFLLEIVFRSGASLWYGVFFFCSGFSQLFHRRYHLDKV